MGQIIPQAATESVPDTTGDASREADGSIIKRPIDPTHLEKLRRWAQQVQIENYFRRHPLPDFFTRSGLALVYIGENSDQLRRALDYLAEQLPKLVDHFRKYQIPDLTVSADTDPQSQRILGDFCQLIAAENNDSFGFEDQTMLCFF